MGVTLLDGVDDRWQWGTLATALQNTSSTAWTRLILCKRAATAIGDSSFDALGYLQSGTTIRAGFSFDGTDHVNMDFGSNRVTTATFTSSTDVLLMILSKGAGTVTPRIGIQVGSGGTMTHANLSGAQADTGSSDRLITGSWKGTADYFDGWIGLEAWWSGAMSDSDKASCGANWRTSDVWNVAHGTPTYLSEYNVAAASFTDLAGNASVLTVTGTTLDTGETLGGWNFNGTGAGAAVSIPELVMAPPLAGGRR